MDRQGDGAGPGPSSLAQANLLSQRRGTSLLPQRWQALQAQLEGKDVELPKSGAHITLNDLIKRTEERLKEELPERDDSVDIYSPLDPDKPITGWLGTPDPRKYAPGTTALSKNELEEEIRAGNVVYTKDWAKAFEMLEPWEQKLLAHAMLTDYAKTRMLVDVDGTGAKKVSVWDLVDYVHHNPELAALARSGRPIVDAATGREVGGTSDALLPYRGSPANPYAMELPGEVVERLPWVLAGVGRAWRRKPTAWLKGIDGVADFDFGVYVNERQAHEVLGPRWGGTNPRTTLASREYWDDVVAAGPAMGMSFVLAAVRDLPVADAAQKWGGVVAKRLAARGVGAGEAAAGLSELGGLLSPGQLAAETKLLSPSGTHIRAGSSLLLTMMPEGTLLVQAMTPDPIATREYYLLGALHGADALCGALTSLAVGGARAGQAPLDGRCVARVGKAVLLAAYGHVTGRADGGDDAPATLPPGRTCMAALAARTPSAFALPPLGPGAQHAAPPVVVHGVARTLLLSDLAHIFGSAAAAADDASAAAGSGVAKEDRVALRRSAAEAALAAGLSQLGVGGKGMGLSLAGAGSAAGGLFESAQPLASASKA